ncbi:MAG: universal stress protein [Aureispira sp.]|nr:universal stress protein [Aureispira sp.]
MKNILVPTDFSDCAAHAKDAALQLAKKTGAALTYIHIMDIPRNWGVLGNGKLLDYPEQIREQIGVAEVQMDNLVKMATKEGVTAKKILTYDQNLEDLIRHIENHDYDMVVMGSHGASGMKEVFLGSVAQKVLRGSTAPVLVIKSKIEDLKIENIAFASTFKEDVDEPFRYIKTIADAFGAKIHLVYINMPFAFEETHKSEARMQAFLDKFPVSNCTMNIFNSFDEEAGILQFAKQHKIDLIATTTHGKSGFIQMLSPSITESLANHAQQLVLSVNVKAYQSAKA